MLSCLAAATSAAQQRPPGKQRSSFASCLYSHLLIAPYRRRDVHQAFARSCWLHSQFFASHPPVGLRRRSAAPLIGDTRKCSLTFIDIPLSALSNNSATPVRWGHSGRHACMHGGGGAVWAPVGVLLVLGSRALCLVMVNVKPATHRFAVTVFYP